MPLEIKILDYGDIELESSFLVLGRDCGRTRRVLTLGFLILGGPWPVVVDTGYRSNLLYAHSGREFAKVKVGAFPRDRAQDLGENVCTKQNQHDLRRLVAEEVHCVFAPIAQQSRQTRFARQFHLKVQRHRVPEL